MLHPSQVILEPHEIFRINRVRLAFLLHKLPDEIDRAKPRDIEDMINIKNVEDEIAARRARPD